MTVNLSNRSINATRNEFIIEDNKDSNGLFVSWKNRFHRYDLRPCGRKTAADLLNGKATDDDWILLIDGMYEESVGAAAFLKKFLETHAPSLARKIRFQAKEKITATIFVRLKWNKYRMSEDSFIGTYYEH